MTPRRKPGPAPTPGPKRTARLVVQVTPDEYEAVVRAAALFPSTADYIRTRLGLPTEAARRTRPTGAEGEDR